jgi:hypothetical protein
VISSAILPCSVAPIRSSLARFSFDISAPH